MYQTLMEEPEEFYLKNLDAVFSCPYQVFMSLGTSSQKGDSMSLTKCNIP
jgi:hypothetical protein